MALEGQKHEPPHRCKPTGVASEASDFTDPCDPNESCGSDGPQTMDVSQQCTNVASMNANHLYTSCAMLLEPSSGVTLTLVFATMNTRRGNLAIIAKDKKTLVYSVLRVERASIRLD